MPGVPQGLQPLSMGAGGDRDTSTTPEGAIGQDVTATAYLQSDAADDEAETYPVTELTFESSRYNQAALLTAKLLADRYPDQNEILTLSINETFVGSGFVDASTVADTGEVMVDAYDSVRRLKQATITVDFQGRTLSDVVLVLAAQADVTAFTDLDQDMGIYTSYENRPCAQVLDELANRVRGVWHTDPTFPGGPPRFTDNLEVDRWQIQHILDDTDAGLQTAPFDGVVVIGGSADGSNALAKNPIRAEAGDTDTADRVYRHEDQSIRSQQAATRVAHSLLDEFERQQGVGKIVLAGDERIQPLDTVTMPESLGGQEYLVSTVKHGLGGTDPFKTTIQVGGLIDGERGPGQPAGGGATTGDGTDPVTFS